MRIGMVLDATFPPDPRVENEAVSLVQAGHEVHLFSLSYQNLPPYEEINGIKIHRYRAGKLVHRLSALAYTVPFFHGWVKPRLKEFYTKTNIEAWHIHDMVIAQAVFDLNRKTRLPVVLDLHENRPAIMEYYHWVKKPLGRLLIHLAIWRRKQRAFIRRADRVVVVTEAAKQEALHGQALAAEKIFVVPNVVTLEIFDRYPLNPEVTGKFASGFNILYVGDTSLRRGTDTAVEALRLLRDQIPEVRLVLVGRSQEDPKLHRLARQLQVEKQFRHEGWQPLSDFPSYIRMAQVCISPIIRNLHHDTTYANKIFQYMALGKPLVVSDCTAQAEVVEKEQCGLVHRASDPEDLAAKILHLYRHPEVRRQMGENGRKAVETTYNWAVASHDLLRLYQELVRKNEP